MRLLNVRLREADEVLVRDLRARGVSISALVRNALRAEARRARAAGDIDVDAVLAQMLHQYPTPERADKERIVSAGRQRLKDAVRSKLRSRR